MNLSNRTIWGYRRENGRVGVRNYVAILPLDDISNAACEAVAAHIQGTIALPHAYGRLQFGEDLELHFRTMIGTGANPNVAACVVIGIGVNVALGANLLEKIATMGLAPIDLAAAGLKEPARNAVAAGLISSFVGGLLEFERDGLKPFVREWMEADALRGRPVTVTAADSFAKGVARGIDLDGALLVETPQGLLRFISGDVSVRAET